jgi:hypothetical protein
MTRYHVLNTRSSKVSAAGADMLHHHSPSLWHQMLVRPLQYVIEVHVVLYTLPIPDATLR